VDLHELAIFLSVAEERSFSRAAERVFRTQPAVSAAVKRLETEVGEALFDRTRKDGTLTTAGETLLPYARRLVNLRDEAASAVKELRAFHRGRLTMGANESTSLYLLPRLLLAYRRRHPRIKIEVYRNVSERIPAEVRERNLDLGFLSYDPEDTSLESFVFQRDELALVVGLRHRLAKRESVTVKELGAESFIAHNVRTPARTKIFELFAKHRTPLNISMELATLETIKEFVRIGAGAAILPRMTVRDALTDGRLVEVPVKGMRIEKPIRVVYRREESLSHAARAFLLLVRAEMPKA
jgi:DNA-binding transcriptional LysR family regulator